MRLVSVKPDRVIGHALHVFCTQCSESISTADAVADLDAAPWTFYCKQCATKVINEEETV